MYRDIENMFRRIDRDWDGVISLEEFQAYASNWRYRISHYGPKRPDEVQFLFRRIDYNIDGYLNFAEFLTAFQYMPVF